MENNRTSYVIKSLICSMANIAIGTILPFFVRTYTIRCLGSEYMGLNNLCTSILYVLNAADLGVANAFAYRLYKPMAQKDTDEICRLLNFYRKVYFIIGSAVFCMGLCIMPFLKQFILRDLPQGINIHIVFLFYLLNSTISYTTYSYKNLIFTAAQRKDYEANLASVYFLLLYGSQIAFVITKHYYLSVFMLPFCTLLENFARNIIVKKKYPQYIARGVVSGEVKNSLKKDIFSVAVYKLRDISRNTFDNIVISTFAGLVILSNYQNYYMIFTFPYMLLAMFYGAIVPSVGNFAATESIDETYEIYRKNVFILMFLSGWFAICYGFLIQDFIVVWLGAEYLMSDVLVFLLAFYIYLLGEISLIKLIRESVGLWNYGRLWAAIEMGVNLILNIVLIIWLGVEGIILATILSIALISIPVENYIIYKHYFVGKFSDRCRLAVTNLIWVMTTAAAVGILCYFAPNIHGVRFFYKVCMCTIVPPLSLVICFRRTEEYRFIRNVVVQIVSRRRHKNKNEAK